MPQNAGSLSSGTISFSLPASFPPSITALCFLPSYLIQQFSSSSPSFAGMSFSVTTAGNVDHTLSRDGISPASTLFLGHGDSIFAFCFSCLSLSSCAVCSCCACSLNLLFIFPSSHALSSLMHLLLWNALMQHPREAAWGWEKGKLIHA